MKNPSKMSFRRPRTVVVPPTEIEIFVTPPSPVFAYVPAPSFDFVFPVAGVVADVAVKVKGLEKDGKATVGIAPEGLDVTMQRITITEDNKAVSVDMAVQVAKQESITVSVVGVPGVWISFMFYPGMTLHGYVKETEKVADAGS